MDSIYKLIKLNKLINNHRVKFAAVLFAHQFKLRHLFLRLDPIMACNLTCSMCYFSNKEYRKEIKGIFKNDEIERIAALFFPKTLQLIIGCGTEPTLYKNFPELVKLAKDYKIPFVGFTSNGQLLTEEHIEKFIHYKLDELTLSVHGVTKETFEKFMEGASFETFHKVLQAIDSTKKKYKFLLPYLRLNYTVNPDNLIELENFFDVFGGYQIKTLQIRPIIDFGGTYRNLLQSSELNKYNKIIEKLMSVCKERNITFLANISDPTYQEENYNSLILQAVRRHITPQVVWRSDFNWRTESYEEFCRRTSWRNHLLKCIFSDKKKVAQYNAGLWGKHSAKYEVIF